LWLARSSSWIDRSFWHPCLQAVFFYGLKIANISPDDAFVEGIFGLVAIDLVGCCRFYLAVWVNNVDDVTADEG